MVTLGPRFEAALAYATTIHGGQTRKGGGIPYISHLLATCSLVLEDGGDEDEAIGALLHDAAEDQGGEARLDDIRSSFGDRVADIVRGCSDTLESPKPRWYPRKKAYLEHLMGETSLGTLKVSLADKLHNARSVLRDVETGGPNKWHDFNAGRDCQLWYYRGLVTVFAASALGGSPMVVQLDAVVARLEEIGGGPSAGCTDDRSREH